METIIKKALELGFKLTNTGIIEKDNAKITIMDDDFANDLMTLFYEGCYYKISNGDDLHKILLTLNFIK